MSEEGDAKKKVLIVEDEHDIRLLYAEILVGAGYDVVHSTNGKEALDYVQNNPWDLILLDIILPVMDGIRVLKEMRSAGLVDKAPVIILSQLNSENIIEEAFKYGASGYLIKSEIQPDKVLQEVEAALAGS